MRAELFMDTRAWHPLLVASHLDHPELAAPLRALIGRRRGRVTTNVVVAETHALLLRRAGREAVSPFVRTVGESPNVVVRAGPELEQRAVRDWLEPYDDQDFSYADAVSFAAMSERGIEEALTLHRHFAAAGFEAVSVAR